MRKKFVLSLAGSFLVFLSGCAAMPTSDPIALGPDYRLLDNSDHCGCGYMVASNKVLKYSGLGKRSASIEVYDAGAKDLLAEAKGKQEVEAIMPRSVFRLLGEPVGKLNESASRLDIDFVAGGSYSFDLRLDRFPDLFDVGFKFGSLRFHTAIELYDYVFAVLRKPGNMILLRFDKTANEADKLVYELSYPTHTLVGQVFAFLRSGVQGEKTEYSHYSALTLDHQTGNFFFGYTYTKETYHQGKWGSRFGEQSTPLIDKMVVFDASGELMDDLTEDPPKSYYHSLKTVVGDALVDGHSLARNKNTMMPAVVENLEYIVAGTSEGTLYFDPASKNYYFRNLN